MFTNITSKNLKHRMFLDVKDLEDLSRLSPHEAELVITFLE